MLKNNENTLNRAQSVSPMAFVFLSVLKQPVSGGEWPSGGPWIWSWGDWGLGAGSDPLGFLGRPAQVVLGCMAQHGGGRGYNRGHHCDVFKQAEQKTIPRYIYQGCVWGSIAEQM